jgi:hypothetical protein
MRKRLTLTAQTVRCPLDGGTASMAVATDLDAAPSRRYRDVAACSLRPATPYVEASRIAYFADIVPILSYVGADPRPCHPGAVACSKPCLDTLNAAEPGSLLDSTSGDALELARHTQTPSMMRVLWSFTG